MKNLTNLFTVKGKTATQSVGLAPKTYARAKALATELNCKIDFVDHNFLKVTAPTVKIAKQFENTIQSEYDITSALYAEAKAQKSSTSKPTQAKGKASSTKKTETKKATPKKSTTSSKKAPKTAKGVSVPAKVKADLDKLAHTNDNSKAHAVMVKHGYTNSNSAEYQAIWRGYWWTIRA